MVTLSIKTDFSQVQKMLKDLPDKVGQQATARALNRTVEAAKTDMNREIRKEFNIDAASVRSELKIERASFTGKTIRLSATLYSGDGKRRGFNLVRFKTAGNSRLHKGQLQFKIRKGKAVTLKGAFVGNKGRTVFMRTGDDRLPIRSVNTIGVAQMFNTRRINEVVVRNMKAKFVGVFEREAAYFLSKYK
jgi:Prophage minor tail protein Z (GPZ)